MTDFVEVPEYSKDLKRIMKKYGSLPNDLELFKKVLSAVLPGTLSCTVRISGLGREVIIPVYKVRKFRCKSLQGRGCQSGIRVIYACEHASGDKVLLLEIYHKNQQENEDKQRILKYLSGKKSLRDVDIPQN